MSFSGGKVRGIVTVGGNPFLLKGWEKEIEAE